LRRCRGQRVAPSHSRCAIRRSPRISLAETAADSFARPMVRKQARAHVPKSAAAVAATPFRGLRSTMGTSKLMVPAPLFDFEVRGVELAACGARTSNRPRRSLAPRSSKMNDGGIVNFASRKASKPRIGADTPSPRRAGRGAHLRCPRAIRPEIVVRQVEIAVTLQAIVRA
jgi:hypothetical protein